MSEKNSSSLIETSQAIRPTDIGREVYGVMGIPIDAVDVETVLQRLKALGNREPYLISTPNLNFLIASQSDAAFRESLLVSDLCTADGAPVVWLARLLGAPIKERVAGSDVFERLRNEHSTTTLKVFFFGGAKGVAAAACDRINASATGMSCVGSYDPGFGSIEDMSTTEIIDTINVSGADFLVVALGAKKGQAWLVRNHERLKVPVRVHLGATINFQAGTVRRAPALLRQSGLEWLWRIWEEPNLWKRYWADGIGLLKLALTKVAPLAFLSCLYRLEPRKKQSLVVSCLENHKSVILTVKGYATCGNIEQAMPSFVQAAAAGKVVTINFTETRMIDARFLGLLLMLEKHQKRQHLRLEFNGVSPRVAKLCRLNGFGFLFGG